MKDDPKKKKMSIKRMMIHRKRKMFNALQKKKDNPNSKKDLV